MLTEAGGHYDPRKRDRPFNSRTGTRGLQSVNRMKTFEILMERQFGLRERVLSDSCHWLTHERGSSLSGRSESISRCHRWASIFP